MVNLKIDGKAVSAESGCTVLEAARGATIEIPTLCHHESLPPYGACRLCLVEVTYRGKTKLVTACTLPVAEGMEINTQSEKALRIRRMLAELLLARCPDSKVIQKLAARFGIEKTRFRKAAKSPSTIVGEAGCIMCGMCVRLCDDVMKIGALSFEGRGGARRVTTPFGEPSDVCMTCGACSSICPTGAIEHSRIWERVPMRIPFEFEEGMTHRKPNYIPFPQAVPRVPVIDKANCIYFKTGGCKVCEDNCAAKAICHAQEDTLVELDAGAIVVATGFQLFDAKPLVRYGYGRFDNVLTALEFERLSHASGPTGGKILTKAGRPPKSVAILHCIGSRDDNYQKYCSRVCCMYSLKFAHLIHEKTHAEVYNFYIDMRAFGKGYEEFYKRLLAEGVYFIRGKAAEVTDAAETPEEEGKLIVIGEDTLLRMTRRIPVDMVILSAGMKPAAGADELARRLSLSCTQGSFYLEKHPKLAPVDTASDGIFLAGACQGPKDIPDAVAQGGAAAAGALSLMDKGKVVLEPITSEINEERCAGCKICIMSCPYAAIEYDEEKKVSRVIEELCKGCGTCVAACPSGAATQKNFEDVQVLEEIAGILA
ncbi:MAG: 2Fe-2S iron-sulfur cluster-binding protein [Candidatus Sumerlaeota bacterium]|nr:2Fe-2S iron-sulfur cluster-binding protein [Candidatus Sumerlaeota bacterium]